MNNILTFIESIFSAARTNDFEQLVRLLNENSLARNKHWIGESVRNDLWPLETALHHGSKEAANILACYLILGRECLNGKKPNEIIATKSIWCKCLGNSTIRLKKLNRKSLRAARSSPNFIYSKAWIPIKSSEDFHPFFYIVRDHYSKLLTPFEAIEHPSAFMALMRLNDNYEIESPEGHSLAGHIIMSRKVNRNDKLAMLLFLEMMGPFYAPLGSEGLTPAIYCLKSNSVFLFKIFRTTDHSEFRSTDGKNIMDYCTNKHLAMLSVEERLKIYKIDGALNTFLIRNATCRDKEKFYDHLVLEAIEYLYKMRKQDQLEKFAGVADKGLGIFMLQIGFKFKSLDRFKYKYSTEAAKEFFPRDAKTTFEFANLPREILEIIMENLTVREIMSFFLVAKKMHQWFKSFNNNAFWKQISEKGKISFEGDIPLPRTDYKQYVINKEWCQHNWRKGKFKEKVLLHTEEYITNTIIDDNWIFAATTNSTLHFMNMHTQEKLQLRFMHPQKYFDAAYCIVESPPLSPPLVAMHLPRENAIYYGRPGANPTKLTLNLAGYTAIQALGPDRVLVSSLLSVVDLNAQCIVATTAEGISFSDVKVNPFNRSMVFGTRYPTLRIFDKDMQVVQTMPFNLTNLGMIDEFTLLGCCTNEGLLLFDIRKLEPKNFQVLAKEATFPYRISIDIRNQRMLAECTPYKKIAQIDLKTRQWERVWKPFSYFQFPMLYDKYMITPFADKRVECYDFSI